MPIPLRIIHSTAPLTTRRLVETIHAATKANATPSAAVPTTSDLDWLRHLERHQQSRRAGDEDDHNCGAVEKVLDRQGRNGRFDVNPWSKERDLRWLTDEKAERGDVADRVT